MKENNSLSPEFKALLVALSGLAEILEAIEADLDSIDNDLFTIAKEI